MFWDPILSGGRDVACATCHHPSLGYSDGLDLSIGSHGVGLGAGRVFAPGHASRFVKRNSQTVLNVAFNGLTARTDPAPAAAPMFWDQIDPLARRLNMRGRSQRDLIAFLRALDDPGFDRTVPNHVTSGLPVGGRIQP